MIKKYTFQQLRKILVRQQDQSDCGIAALQTVIRWHGGESFSEDLRIASGTNSDGTTMLGLIQAARENGFEADGYEMDIEYLSKQTVPCILHLFIDGLGFHYMVYLGHISNKDLIILGDPDNGIKLYSTRELSKLWLSKSAVILSPNETFVKVKQRLTKEKTKWFYKNIEKDIPYLSINLTLGIIISLISITTAIFSQKLIDHLLPERSYNQIVVGLILLFLILTSRSLISYLRQYVMLQQSQAYNKRLTGFFLDKIIKLPKLFFNSRKKGDLIGRLNDTQRIQQNISHIIGNFVIDTLVIIVSLAAVFIYSVLVGIIVTTIIPAIIYLVYTYTNKFVKAQKKVMNSYSQLESYYINILSGISAIKENGAQSFFIDMGKENFAIYQSAIFTLGTLTNRLTLKVDFISAIMSVGIIAICTNLFFKDQLSIGALIAIISLVSSILPSIIRIAQINVNIQEIKVAFERIFDLTNTKEETLDEESQDKIAFKSFRMENVCFRFNGRPILYDKMKLEINKGELIGIIGESGMGKSTLTEIIQGFYTPYEGNFYINDKLYSSLQLSSWRKCYATVPQEIKIFNGNIYFNIVLNRPCTEKEFQKFCNNYGFDILFQKWSINYLTLIGEEGQKLSGGQKQILGLARALYKNPQLLLLDESTSALDKYTESFILKLLKRLKMENNMAIFFITHKNFITEIANRTYKLENKTLSIIEDLNSIESQ